MKAFLLFMCLLMAMCFTSAQPKTEPAGGAYPDGYTKTTFPPTTDESLNKVTRVEYKDKDGILKNRLEFKQDLTNKWTVVSEQFKPSGESTCKTTYQYDQENKLTRREIKYNQGNTTIHVRNSEGQLRLESDPESKNYLSLGDVFLFERALKLNIQAFEQNVSPPIGLLNRGCGEPGSTGDCGNASKFDLYFAYSYLNGDYGNDRESLPLGGHFSALYNVNQHIKVGLDASIHTKKDGDFKLSRSFVMIEGVYVFGDAANCDRKIIFDVHVLAGLGSESVKFSSGTFNHKSSGSGLAFGGGAGVNLNVNRQLAVRLFQADYILTKYETDNVGNFRASTGLVLRLGDK